MADLEREKGGASCPIFPKQGRRAVVLCDGPPPETELLEYWLTGADFFICTDAAGHPYDELPVEPDVVIGDFDALAGRILAGKGGPRFLHVADQVTSDSEKALLYVEQEGYTEAVVLGATGWRLDHTLYNCHLLERFAGRLRLCLATFDADVVRLGAGDAVSWKLPVGTGFSLLPLAGPVRGVVLEGARYPLLSGEVVVGGPATISNDVAQTPLLISVTEGSLLVTVSRTVEDEMAMYGGVDVVAEDFEDPPDDPDDDL
jgi:thiamine pyrophosphokinase